VPRGAANADALAITHDLYPTILDWTGVAGDPTQNAEMDGVSLVPVLEGGSAQPARPRLALPAPEPAGGVEQPAGRGGAWVSAIRRGETKLMYFYDERRFEMYDVETDPAERTTSSTPPTRSRAR
jgi:arylsulfatase A-like enzyme